MKTSVITFNRNDGYKEKERFIIHINTLLETFDEVNYVDWNSPTHSFLYDIIDKIPKTGRLKHFVISPSIHTQIFNQIEGVPWFSTGLALNLALRRTNADWIVATTSDIIPPFKWELEEFLSKANPNTFYTLSRREVDYASVLLNKDNLDEYRKTLSQTLPPRYFSTMVTPNDHYSLINCCGDFQLASNKVWTDIKGYEEQMIFNCFIDTNTQKKAVLNNFGLEAIYDIPLYHMSHKNHLPQGENKIIHEVTKTSSPKYNDPWEWVEYFTTSQNSDNWGFNDTEIEFEII